MGRLAKDSDMRLVWTILFGALVTLLFGAVVAHETGLIDARRLTGRRVTGGRLNGRFTGGRMRRLLTVEEAARWRPE
jgi:hypothetical protein